MKDNCFTEFCCFLSNLSMNQPQVNIYLLPLFPPSHDFNIILIIFIFSRSLLKLMSTEPVMTSNHLILCHSLLLLSLIFPSIRVFSNESVLCIRWPKYWSFGASASGYKLPKFISLLQYSNINSYPYTLYV